MALTLTIGGDNFLPQYKTGSARIVDQLQNRGNTFTLELTRRTGQDAPQEGKEIIFKDGSRFLFGGFVTRVQPVEIGLGSFFVYQVEATDYSYVVINKNAQKVYENETLHDIVEDLLDTYVDAGYGLTITNVVTGPTIETVSFNHITLRKAFEKLAALTGYEWWFDYEKDLHFKPKSIDNAPEEINDTDRNHESLSVSVDLSQVRNSIVVRGGREETSAFFQQIIVCDGEAREWLLREKPKTLEYIKLNTVTQTTGVDPLDNDDEASLDFLFNFQEKFIRCSSAQATPANGDEIEVSYKYEVPVIVLLQDATSIAAIKALEGGDGIHDFTIVESSIKSKGEARQRALKELLEYANPLVTGVFATRTGLLQAGSYFKAGQAITIYSPVWGISTPTQYVVQEVTTSLFEDGTNIEYNYVVRFGGRLISAGTFLESLAGKEDPIFATEEIDTIKAITEEITITEDISRNSLLKSITETVTVSESISRLNTTPPFKWGVTGTKPGKWGASEWG